MEATLQQPSQQVCPHTPGAFVWHELGTDDVSKAQAFYGGLFGWTFESNDMGSMIYHLAKKDGIRVGGMYEREVNAEMPAAWLGSISVKDVDACADAAVKAGGQLLMEATDIPNVGRYACVMDSQGAVFSLFNCLMGDPESNEPVVGDFCWDSLQAKDTALAESFYKAVIGWEAKPGFEGMEDKVFYMGELMEASLAAAPEGVHPHWISFVQVTDLAASNKKVIELGGKVVLEKVELPFGGFSIIQDPTGGHLGLFYSNETK